MSMVVAKLLVVDEHPTLTRLFTSRGGVGRMLTMDLLGLPRAGFEVKSSARELSHKRLGDVKACFGKPVLSQALRGASLVLLLPAGVEAAMSATPKPGEAPTVVAVLQGTGSGSLG